MKILKLSWRNFLSYGNDWTELDFSLFPKVTAIVGASGAGKSTIFDALFFSLYGKPMRSINKGDLVNKQNGRDAEVHLLFEKGGKQYKIERGIKPNFLRVYCDDEEIPSENLTEMQSRVEEIVGMNMTTAKQLLLISHGSRLPFFRMSKAERRRFLDENLDMEKVSQWQKEVKNVLRGIEKEIAIIEGEVAYEKHRLDAIVNDIVVAEQKKSEVLDGLEMAIKNKKNELKAIEDILSVMKVDISEMSEKDRKVSGVINALKNDIYRISNDIKKLKDSNVCPLCKRPFDDEHIEQVKKKVRRFNKELKQKEEKLQYIEEKYKVFKKHYDKKVEEYESKRNVYSSLFSSLKVLEERKRNAISDEYIRKLKDEKSKVEKQIENKSVVLRKKKKQLELMEKLVFVFSDEGVKKMILMQVIPVLAAKCSEYATMLGVGCNVTFDTMLNETIDVGGKEYTYEALSDGERMRLDIALLFAWHWVISSMTGDFNDMVFLDEITANLDEQNIEIFKDFLFEMPMRFVLITHNSVLQNAIDGFVNVERRGLFSEIRVSI